MELSEAGASSKSKISELEGALERTKRDLAGQKSALEEKLSSLEAAVADRNDLEKRLGSTVEEKEANDIRIATLKEELDLMAQDNRWGFSSDVCICLPSLVIRSIIIFSFNFKTADFKTKPLCNN